MAQALHPNVLAKHLLVTKDKLTTIHTVAIIGGGPAGVATAITLRQRGIACTLLEAAPTVPHKIGETLPPTVQNILQALGADHLLQHTAHLPCYGNTWLWGSPTVQEKSFLLTTHGHGWHLNRQVFETELLALAQEKGANLHTDTKLLQAVYDTTSNIWQLQVKTGHHPAVTHTCQFVVDASGRNSKLARCLGIERTMLASLTGTSTRFQLPAGATPAQLTYTEATLNGWWYAAVTSGQQLVTAYMTDADLLPRPMQSIAGYWQAIQQTQLIKTLFPADYTPPVDTTVHTQSAGTSALTQVYGNGWLAVGDAAFAYDPVSSYGITSALGSGIYAGHAIADHLAGNTEALPAYRYVTEKTFAAYLPMLQHQYALEKRWPEQEFWKRRG